MQLRVYPNILQKKNTPIYTAPVQTTADRIYLHEDNSPSRSVSRGSGKEARNLCSTVQAQPDWQLQPDEQPKITPNQEVAKMLHASYIRGRSKKLDFCSKAQEVACANGDDKPTTTLSDLTERLMYKKNILQSNVEDRFPAVLKFEEDSRVLHDFHVVEVEEVAPDHTIKLDRVGADIPIVRRHGSNYHRLTLIGSDGSQHHFPFLICPVLGQVRVDFSDLRLYIYFTEEKKDRKKKEAEEENKNVDVKVKKDDKKKKDSQEDDENIDVKEKKKKDKKKKESGEED
nr:transformation/transcription domain-associated protein isoform X2 [Tanacetum cinerariifolium]GEX20961.1 transformation/transcription domain-associated protein isoform X2 [Tanacetum cinerariifolium]